MHIRKWLTVTTFLLVAFQTFSQKRCTISTTDLTGLIGCWQGTLNYSGTIIRKPYNTTANLTITRQKQPRHLEMIHAYSTDSGDDKHDTMVVSANGRRLNNEPIIARKKTGKGSLKIVTQVQGFDKGNQQNATIRKTYIINKKAFAVKKEVRLTGQKEWLESEQFSYNRIDCECDGCR